MSRRVGPERLRGPANSCGGWIGIATPASVRSFVSADERRDRPELQAQIGAWVNEGGAGGEVDR